MIQTIEIFYSFQCPYCYLAIDRLSLLDRKFEVQTLWQPFSAKASGQNYSSFPVSQDRASYIREDVIRLAQTYNMPLVIDDNWPEVEFDPEKSIRGALIASDLNCILEYNIKMFDRWWAVGENPNDQDFFVELCDDLDLDPNEFAGRISASETRNRVRGAYKRGKKLKVFELPTILIGKERFVGIDRIAMAEQRLMEMGLQKKIEVNASSPAYPA